jgi:hypothetical protein
MKPLAAYETLPDDRKRLTNRLIMALHENKLDSNAQLDIRRSINRAKRDPNDTGKRYTNGYLIFYKERFPVIKKDYPEDVTLIAKKIGEEWRALSSDTKNTYKQTAATQR